MSVYVPSGHKKQVDHWHHKYFATADSWTIGKDVDHGIYEVIVYLSGLDALSLKHDGIEIPIADNSIGFGGLIVPGLNSMMFDSSIPAVYYIMLLAGEGIILSDDDELICTGSFFLRYRRRFDLE